MFTHDDQTDPSEFDDSSMEPDSADSLLEGEAEIQDPDERDHEHAVQHQLRTRLFSEPHNLLEGWPEEPALPGSPDDDPRFTWAYRLVWRLAGIILRDAVNHADIEDAAQNVALALWIAWAAKPELRRDPKRLLQYLWKAFRYRRINLHRRETRANRWQQAIDAAIEMIDPKATDAQAKLERLELLRFLYDEIEKFPPKRQRIMKLLFVEGLSHTEAAKVIGRTKPCVTRAVAIAMQVLRKSIAIHFQEALP